MNANTVMRTLEKARSISSHKNKIVHRASSSNTKLQLVFLVLLAFGTIQSHSYMKQSSVEAMAHSLGVSTVYMTQTARYGSFALTSLISLYFLAQVMGEGEGEGKGESRNKGRNTDTTKQEVHTSTTLTLKNVIGASRPPMWFATAFPYMMSATDKVLFSSPDFYIGLVYVTLPLNLFLCGMNDVMDWDVDHLSKKRSSAWRQNLTKVQLEKLRRIILIIQAPFFLWSISTPGLVSQGTGGIMSSPLLWWLNASFQIALYNGTFPLHAYIL